MYLLHSAIGAGAIESNMAVFGAEQNQELNIKSRYFDKYIAAVNIGAIFAMWATPFTLNDDNFYHIVYMVTASVLFVAASLFLIGWRFYIHVKSNETVITKCIPVVINACRSRHQYKKKINTRSNEQLNSSTLNSTSAFHSLIDGEKLIIIDERPSTFLDFAKVPNGKFHDRIVDDVKSLRSAFIVFSLFIPYWLVYTQVRLFII